MKQTKQMQLIKLSSPSWELKFSDEYDLADELFKYICNECRFENGIHYNSNLEDMLSTPCGCEFMVECKQDSNSMV